jgi:hypothetical protein
LLACIIFVSCACKGIPNQPTDTASISDQQKLPESDLIRDTSGVAPSPWKWTGRPILVMQYLPVPAHGGWAPLSSWEVNQAECTRTVDLL